MKRIMLMAIALLVAGCSTLPPVVEVPVPVPCSPPPATVRPKLALAHITPATPDNEVIRAYRTALEQMYGYAKELEILLGGYR